MREGISLFGVADLEGLESEFRISPENVYKGLKYGVCMGFHLSDRVLEGIEDSVVVAQEWQNDSRVILFVKMKAGYALTDELRSSINTKIRNNASPRHVPAKIIQVPDIPYTLNMKKVELAVKKVIHGQEVKNKDSLKNPESLDFFEQILELQE